MSFMLRLLLAILPFMWQVDPPGDPKDPPADPKDPPADPPKKVEFTPEQNEWIGNKIAYELKKAQEKRDAEDAEAKKKAEAEAERKKQEAAGQFDEVKQSLESERDAAVRERDSLKTERDALADYVKADVAAVTKAVKDAKDSAAAKALLDFYPGDDAEPTTLLAWAGKAKSRLGEISKQSPRGNREDPPPGRLPKDEIPSPLPKNQYM